MATRLVLRLKSRRRDKRDEGGDPGRVDKLKDLKGVSVSPWGTASFLFLLFVAEKISDPTTLLYSCKETSWDPVGAVGLFSWSPYLRCLSANIKAKKRLSPKEKKQYQITAGCVTPYFLLLLPP